MPSTPEVIGKYKIERFLASGGMGDIYLARDPMLDRLVAIKLLREGFDSDELRERFEREARAAGRLSHPNIVTIHEFGLFEGRPFIAMEYVPGESLAVIIRRREPLALTRKLEIIEGLCAGLAHAHRANIVHRDIKPANLIVDPEGGVKVLDFGIVKLAGSGLTHHGVLVGTANYMSPEQINSTSDGVDLRSDVFAVGAVFYELLSYQRAFPGELVEVLYKIVHTSPDPISRLCPGLDPGIERAVHKCLERAPERRYQDLTALRRDVARIRQRLDLEETPDSPAPSVDTLILPTPSHSGSAGVPPLTPDRISGLLVSAQAALEGRDIDRALLLCEQAAAIAPADTRVREMHRAAQAARDAQRVEALLAEAVGHLEAQRLVEARVAIDLVMATDPDSARALELRQRIEQVAADEERRKEWSRRLGAAMNRARADFERGALTDARAAVEEALGLDPENAGAITLRQRIDTALALEQERLRREEEARVQQRDARLGAARAALAGDDLAAALVAVDEAVSFGAADDANALRVEIAARQRDLQRAAQCVRDGQARLEQGDLDAASKLVDEALAIVPTHADAVPLRARIVRAVEEKRARDEWLRSTFEAARDALRKGQHDAALASLEQVSQAEPSWPGLADLVQQATRQRAAALERQRRDDEIQRHVAHATELLARQDLDAARLEVDSALKLDPASRRAIELGVKIDGAVEVRRAEEARRRAEEERARRVEQIARGREALTAGRVDEAVDVLRRMAGAAQHEPGFTELLRQAEAEQARLEAERRREREREQRIAAALDRARQRLDERAFEAATAAVDEALAIDGAHPEALAARERIATALEQRLDTILRDAASYVAKGKHQRAIETIEGAGFTHPRLDAELDGIRRAAEALALEARVDEALTSARGRFRRRAPEDILKSLQESGLHHPRIEHAMEAARQSIADAAQRAAAAAAEAQRVREQKARDDEAREEQARAQKALADQARAEQARADKAAQEKARADKALADRARAEQARADRAASERAAAERAAAQEAAVRKAREQKAGPARADDAMVPAATRPIAWQRPAALAAIAALLLIAGYFVARQIRPASPDPGTAQVQRPSPSPLPASPADAPRRPSSTANPPATSNPNASPAPTDAPAAPPGTPAISPGEQAQAAATRIGQLLAQGQRERAIEESAAASPQLAREPALREAIRGLIGAAQADAQRSRDRATKAGARERDAAGFAAAQGTFQAAERARQRGRLLDAAREYWKADALFAGTLARASAPQPAQAQASPPAQAVPQAEKPRETDATILRQNPVQQIPAPTPTVQQPPPVVKEPDRSTAPQAPAFDPAAVQSVLDAYAAGYTNRSVEAIVRVYPNFPSDQRGNLERTFNDASSYELTLGRCEITQQLPAAAAAACTGGRRSIRFKAGRRIDQAVSPGFTLERRGTAWVITAVRF